MGEESTPMKWDIEEAFAWRFRPYLKPLLNRLAKWRLSRKIDLFPLTKRSSDALSPDYCDLLFLYQMIVKLVPGVIFEFGSGCSTYVIGAAILRNWRIHRMRAQFTSLESDPHWYEETKRMLGPYCEMFVVLQKCEIRKGEKDGIPIVIHTNLPNLIPDFVYLDGPSGPQDEMGIRIAADLLSLKLKPGFCCLIDGRKENVEFLKATLPQAQFKKRALFNNTVLTIPYE